MNTFKRKALSCAILGGLAVASGAAQAVYEDPNGLGQALIYPYYTVQAGYNTYLSVVNTTTRAKALKVRFREGKNSREVLDFNLYLSPNDVWTAALGAADATATSGAILVTGDNSCTAPPIPAGGVPFRNFQYVGTNADNGPTTLDRTREGYFEIIEMANLQGAAAAAVTHTSAGVPANCNFVQPPGFTAANNAAFLLPPNGGLTGTYQLINVPAGLNFGGNATALAQFSSTIIYQDIGNDNLNLSNANPPVAVTVANNPLAASGPGTEVYVATYANGRDAVSATMMHSSVINEYSLDAATKSATDWVMTFPTKQFYVSPGTGAAVAPFAVNFGSTGSCEPISLTIFNREEQQPTSGGSQPFSPLPPGVAGPALCWEAQVISFLNQTATLTASTVLASQNYNAVATGFQNGWMQIGFIGTNAATTGLSSVAGTGTVTNVNTGAVAAAATVNYKGLPVIGFAARTLNNGSALTCATSGGASATCAGAYGVALDHKYTVSVTPTP